ncbi:hypothetical protein ACO0RG_000653 [Hanseniaspora osmophila]|uniref:ATP synthase F(0) complex subunit e, mitochondrial n=1 Tax=Hanseniaspora osmophila TaxID=56408 RepID=A0A1E5R2C7_9ASCO|nr:ATP synthase subunit e, mitochondrial [Hanseniaspora osmophila]
MSQTVNVFRYSALALGLLVGLKTDMRASSDAHTAAELHKQEELIKQAKEAYAKAHAPAPSAADSAKQATTAAPKFDLEDEKADFAQLILSSVEALEKAK